MDRLIAQGWKRLRQLLLKRIILVLTLMFCIGVGVALSNMSRLSSSLIEAQATQNAVLYTQSFNEAINLYSDAAVDRAKAIKGVDVTHTYLTKQGAIPLPSTFAIELGKRVTDKNNELAFRLYSDFPFPSRKAQGGAKDAFERDAIDFLKKNPRQQFTRLERHGDHTSLRYAEASLMKPTCVACHNTHPDSPKKDWEVGNIGGVWEVTQSLDSLVNKTNRNLTETFFTLGGISVLGLSGITLVIGKQRQTTRELEGRVRERTADLAQANVDLEKRNGLIRQVFGRYLSDSIVANLLETPEGLKLGGDRRNITILTSDLRGFTALSERLSPEQVIQILNLYLEHMADVINHYEGTIDEFMGDGILVLFGAPIAKENDALRAIACACAMQLAMGAVNEKLKPFDVPHLEMGIGIHTGEVVVGNIGSEKRTKYGIVGSPVNLAYRIESYTQGGQILVSQQTLTEAGSNVRINKRLNVQPKGFKQAIAVYDIAGIAGFYNLYLPKEEETFVQLPEGIPLQFALVEGKHVGDRLFYGKLIRLSQKGAELHVNRSELQPLFSESTTLKLNILAPERSEDFYAKVSQKAADTDSLYICFTAITPNLQKYFEGLFSQFL
ncbi:MAG: adenylate/guanylate cyclase domain-containing protein [Myxacorys californica WJT36-NPBG1]|jgi:adenylate cyclase|nr:adenylate/guanylate cyclase domain-containing protein [Myxacorys californica WJT36-NPBG1]